MYRSGPTFAGAKFIQAGVLVDTSVIKYLNMEVELFAPQRVSWLSKLHFTEDKHDMN